MNKQWILRKRPVGDLADGDLEYVETPVPELQDGEVRARTIYLSIDPTNRIWMSDMDGYLPPVGIGDVMRGGGLAVVEESRFADLAPGDLVLTGIAGWSYYTIAPGAALSKIPPIPGVPLTAWMGPLGATGMTAYFGLLDIADPQPGETLVVSAAAGAVGSVVGQIGKIKGCRVVGIAGADDKCKWIVDELGFDAAINYKTEDVDARLGELCPKGIDVYFENVGGKTLDAVLNHINDHSRIPLCGLISTYNATEPVPGPYNFAQLLMRRTKLKGFIILDYLDRFPEGVAQMMQWMQEGKIKFATDVVDGLENASNAVDRLFVGANTGKLVVKVSDEP
ncbi:MAG: NADP-dependent oxidoreductase [Pseudomonadota bacterium]